LPSAAAKRVLHQSAAWLHQPLLQLVGDQWSILLGNTRRRLIPF
jgi:hypothetical protein